MFSQKNKLDGLGNLHIYQMFRNTEVTKDEILDPVKRILAPINLLLTVQNLV